MKIRTQLFFGTAALVLALVGIQWWMHHMQLLTLEQELSEVAATVGENLLLDYPSVVIPGMGPGIPALCLSDLESLKSLEKIEILAPKESDEDIIVLGDEDGKRRIIKSRKVFEPDQERELQAAIAIAKEVAGGLVDIDIDTDESLEHLAGVRETIRQIELRVEVGEDESNHFLVIAGGPGGDRQVPIPVAGSRQAVRANLHQGLAASGVLLTVGLVLAGLLSHRVSRPLRELAVGAEAIGHGKLGTQVASGAGGEVGELQTAFNIMSRRLSELESEKMRWQAREHLAELGFLARGLAHTLRNPLNTLGLVVEELADRDQSGSQELVDTSRAQLRRIDRWLRSFLAVGAGEAACAEEVDLLVLIRDVVLEAVQQGGDVEIQACAEPLSAKVVPTALRSALGNLVANAQEASDETVTVSIDRDGSEAVISISDRGPGISDEVRQRLFTPHVTTKVNGSGMGLYLARQLVESAHYGRLELLDREGGGTVAVVRLPLEPGTEGGGGGEV